MCTCLSVDGYISKEEDHRWELEFFLEEEMTMMIHRFLLEKKI